MTKKTRVRVARIAAGAVIAAGASLTAAGAAQAVGIGVNIGGLSATAEANEDGLDVGLGIQGDNEGGDTAGEWPAVSTGAFGRARPSGGAPLTAVRC